MDMSDKYRRLPPITVEDIGSAESFVHPGTGVHKTFHKAEIIHGNLPLSTRICDAWD
jgi:hypothetical protein